MVEGMGFTGLHHLPSSRTPGFYFLLKLSVSEIVDPTAI